MARAIPPGPKGHFLSGNLPEFRAGRFDFLCRCSEEFGDIVRLRLGSRVVYLLTHPELIEEVLVSKARLFRKHFALRLNPLVFGNGLLTSEGNFWLRQRRLMQPAFNRNRIDSYSSSMVDAAQRRMADWKPGQTREISVEMEQLTLAIAAKTLFGAEINEEGREVGQALRHLQQHFVTRFANLVPIPIWVPTPENLRLRRVVRRLDRIIYRFIDQRRRDGEEKNDLLSILLHARDDDNRRMTDKQVRDEAMTLFLAGHETTALGLSWTWYLLAQHPDVEGKLCAEFRQVLGGRPPTADDLPRLPYAEQVVLESMRLYPPVYAVGREALRKCEVGGFHVPKGTSLIMNQWLLHRDARFFDAPTVFRPERWTDEMKRDLPKFAYFPFSGGPRVCIGNHFAMMEMILVIATIAQRFRFALEPGQEITPQPSFTLRPSSAIRVKLEEREQARETVGAT